MKFSIYIVLIVLGLLATATAEDNNLISEKENLRLENKFNLIAMIGISHVDHCPLPLTPKQRDFLQDEIQEFGGCLNTTIDILFDNLDNEIQRNDFRNLTKAHKYIPQLCAVLNSFTQCFRDFVPAFELCMSAEQKQVSNNLLTFVPMYIESVCLQNGTRLLEILAHRDGIKCVSQTYNWLSANHVAMFFLSKRREMSTDCIEYKRIQTEVIRQLDGCSPAVSELAKRIVGQFCRATKCQKYVADLNC